MRLIIQIPCYNEEETLGITLSALPRKIPGISIVEWLVVDDGSSDDTVAVARSFGVDHIVSHARNEGLAKTFRTGIDACLEAGADIIVNIDADNQYCADDIPKLIEPILKEKAEIVIGARPIKDIRHFSFLKKTFQKLGSFVVRRVSGTDVPDAPSGFRAMSREAALNLNIFSEYTYTLEMIIHAGRKGIPVASVPIRVNPPLRPSRLIRSIPRYVIRSSVTILRIFMVYQPLKFFMTIGGIFFSLGVLLGTRYLWLMAMGEGRGHVQSVILMAVLLLIGLQVCLFGLLSDLIAVNRYLVEDVQIKIRKMFFSEQRGKKG
jgi:glycosyltransferase involved in cell wall biosynthesis